MDIILIAGLWLDSSVWDQTAAVLRDLGHRPIPVALPGQGDGNTSATLADQVAAVVTAVDMAGGRPLVVGHSAACSLAWLAADARPDRIGAVALVGGFPSPDGEAYAAFFPVVDGVMPFPGWGPFEGADSADLDTADRARISAAAIAVPEAVSTGVVRLTDDARFGVQVVLICPEFSPDQAKEWVASGELPELARVERVDYVDIDSGHWPMLSSPEELARVLATVADRVG